MIAALYVYDVCACDNTGPREARLGFDGYTVRPPSEVEYVIKIQYG